MHSILVPTDFSISSRKTLDFALSVYPPHENKYILLRCKPVNQTQEILVSIDDILEKNILEKLNAERDYIRSRTEKDSDVEIFMDPGDLSTAINNCLKKSFTDLVILGSCMNNVVGSGDTTTSKMDFIEQIPVSTLLVPELKNSNELKHILFATRLTGINKEQISPLLELAKENKRHISILNVGLENPFGKDLPLKLEEMVNGYFNGTDFTMHVVQESDPFRAITLFSEEKNCDMICIVYKRHNFIERLIRENVSKKLLEGYQRPLMILKE